MFYKKVVGTVLDLLIPGELYSCRRSLLFAYIQARFPSTSPLSQKWLVQFSKKFSVQGDMVCGDASRKTPWPENDKLKHIGHNNKKFYGGY